MHRANALCIFICTESFIPNAYLWAGGKGRAVGCRTPGLVESRYTIGRGWRFHYQTRNIELVGVGPCACTEGGYFRSVLVDEESTCIVGVVLPCYSHGPLGAEDNEVAHFMGVTHARAADTHILGREGCNSRSGRGHRGGRHGRRNGFLQFTGISDHGCVLAP